MFGGVWKYPISTTYVHLNSAEDCTHRKYSINSDELMYIFCCSQWFWGSPVCHPKQPFVALLEVSPQAHFFLTHHQGNLFSTHLESQPGQGVYFSAKQNITYLLGYKVFIPAGWGKGACYMLLAATEQVPHPYCSWQVINLFVCKKISLLLIIFMSASSPFRRSIFQKQVLTE